MWQREWKLRLTPMSFQMEQNWWVYDKCYIIIFLETHDNWQQQLIFVTQIRLTRLAIEVKCCRHSLAGNSWSQPHVQLKGIGNLLILAFSEILCFPILQHQKDHIDRNGTSPCIIETAQHGEWKLKPKLLQLGCPIVFSSSPEITFSCNELQELGETYNPQQNVQRTQLFIPPFSTSLQTWTNQPHDFR